MLELICGLIALLMFLFLFGGAGLVWCLGALLAGLLSSLASGPHTEIDHLMAEAQQEINQLSDDYVRGVVTHLRR